MDSNINKLYEFEGFCLDGERLILTRNNEIVELPPKVVELLVLLIENRKQVVGKEFLIKNLWSDSIVEESNLTQNIYLLRKVLGKTSGGESFVKTFSKRGYKFTAEVETKSAVEFQPPETENEINKSVENTAEKTDSAENRLDLINDSKIRHIGQKSTFSQYKIAGFSLFLFLLLFIGTGFYIWSRSPQYSPKGIAILPFKTINTNQEIDVLGLGMTDAIITKLSKTNKIRVLSADAVRRYDVKKKDLVEIGNELNVESILKGNIQQIDKKIRVNVQLLRVSDNTVLWTEQFDKNLDEIFPLQDLIAYQLANALTIRLSDEEQKQLTARHTSNFEAYELYLKGRFFFAKRTPEWIQKAITCFEEAIKLDPNYAFAYAGLADAYAVTASGLPPAQRFPKAKTAALRALALDESIAEAHTSLAFIIYKSEFNWSEAEKHFRRAVELNPNYALAHHWFGEFLGLQGKFEEGIYEFTEAAKLDPLSFPIKADTARLYYRARRYDQAIELSLKTIELDSNYRNAWNTLVYAYEAKKLYEKAVEADLQGLRIGHISSEQILFLEQTFKSSGWKEYWRKRLELMKNNQNFEYAASYELSETYIRLGENDRALEYLKQSVINKEDGLLHLKIEPLLDSLRSEPEFINLFSSAK